MSSSNILNLKHLDSVPFKAYSTKDPVKQYIVENSLRLTDIQEKLIKETITVIGRMSAMLGSPDEMQFLANLCKMIGAKKTLDIGVFTGYSALTIAMALPEDGKVIACDISEEFVNVGKPYWKAAGVYDKIDLRLAPATETLEKLIEDGQSGTFDYAFIDADKVNYQVYYELCLKLVRKGGFIAIDNTLWGGDVVKARKGELNPDSEDASVRDACIIDKLNKFLFNDNRIDISFIHIGDGTTLCIKK